MKYYVYQHIRLDKNEIFYIGFGSKQFKISKTFASEYHRAHSKHNRNIHWKNVTNLTDYKIEIIFESNIKQEALNEEIRLIALYGREDLGIGPLVNFTDGGDGTHNVRVTKEFREKMRIKMTLINHARSPVLQYDLEGNFIREWLSFTEAANSLNLKFSQINDCAALNDSKNKLIDTFRTSNNFIWIKSYENYNIKINPLLKNNGSFKRADYIYEFDLSGKLLNKWLGHDLIEKHYNYGSLLQITLNTHLYKEKIYFREKDLIDNYFDIITYLETGRQVYRLLKNYKFNKRQKNIMSLKFTTIIY
jgi:hypothetical protein